MLIFGILQLAHVLVDEMAAPVLALACDDALYDVAHLEERLYPASSYRGGDFFARVVSAGCAGLDHLDALLRAGRRPTEARILPGAYLPLPPCDTRRAAYLRVELGGGVAPRFDHRDARALVGDGQPVGFPAGCDRPAVGLGVAVLLREDVWRATAEAAARAILGATLLLDWRADDGPAPPAQLGPALHVPASAKDLEAATLALRIGERSVTRRLGDLPFQVAEGLAWTSQHCALAAGDVVGLVAPDAEALAYGERVALRLDGWAGELSGWAARGPEPADWRRR